MILGIGTDILKVQRIRVIYGNADDPFFKNTYTRKEQQEGSERHEPALYFATRFAGKEAVFKSLGIDGMGVTLKEIEILSSEVGQPRVALLGAVKALAENKGIKKVLISLSYDDDDAVAFAVATD
jgi:holo-[acyl-carrier protein] synthase